MATINNQDLNRKSPVNQELIEFLKKSGEYWKTHRRDDVVPNLEDFERYHGEVVAGGKTRLVRCGEFVETVERGHLIQPSRGTLEVLVEEIFT